MLTAKGEEEDKIKVKNVKITNISTKNTITDFFKDTFDNIL